MFFSKGERKKSSACMLLAVGALSFIGAASIFGRGKKIVNGISNKIKSIGRDALD